MESILIAAVLACAAPASAQVAAADQVADIAAVSAEMRAVAKKAAPAVVDPSSVAVLIDRLAKYGTIERRARMDALGRSHGIRMVLVEVPAKSVEGASRSKFSDLLLRRYFSRLEAQSDDWSVDPRTGAASIDAWKFIVSLDGKLLAVENVTVPVDLFAPGGPKAGQGRVGARVPPSHPEAQRRWKRLFDELLTLGKIREV